MFCEDWPPLNLNSCRIYGYMSLNIIAANALEGNELIHYCLRQWRSQPKNLGGPNLWLWASNNISFGKPPLKAQNDKISEKFCPGTMVNLDPWLHLQTQIIFMHAWFFPFSRYSLEWTCDLLANVGLSYVRRIYALFLGYTCTTVQPV